MLLNMPRGEMLRRMDSNEVSEWIAFFNARQQLDIQEPEEKQSIEEMKRIMGGVAVLQKKADKWTKKRIK